MNVDLDLKNPVGTIRKLQPQWRISHQFETSFYGRHSQEPFPVSLRVVFGSRRLLKIDFPFPNMRVKFGRSCMVAPIVCQAPPPGKWSKIEVTHKRLDIEGMADNQDIEGNHDMEDNQENRDKDDKMDNQENQEHQDNSTNQDKRDKYVFVLTVDEQEMGRVEVNSLRKKTLRNLTDVKIFIGPPDPVPYGQDPVQDGSIKELIVLDRF